MGFDVCPGLIFSRMSSKEKDYSSIPTVHIFYPLLSCRSRNNDFSVFFCMISGTIFNANLDDSVNSNITGKNWIALLGPRLTRVENRF